MLSNSVAATDGAHGTPETPPELTIPAGSVEQVAKIANLKGRLIAARKFAAQAETAYGEKYKELIEVLEATRNAWEAQNRLVVDEHERCKTFLENTEKEIRQELCDWSKETGDKRFDDHLSVRCTVKLEYDLDDATQWARNNAPYALVADKKKFELIAKDKNSNLDFVTKTPTYAAVIATEIPEPVIPSEGGVA
jgi:hypothetical protein